MDSQNTMGGENNNMSGHSKNLAMAIISYIGPLVIIAWIMAKGDEYVKFHVRQGLVLLSIEVVMSILSSILWQFWMIYQTVHLAVLILSIIGIINASQGKEKGLPLVGDWSKHFNI